MRLYNNSFTRKGKLAKFFVSFSLFLFLFACGGDGGDGSQNDQQENLSEEEQIAAVEDADLPTGSVTGLAGFKAIGPNKVVATSLTSNGFGLVEQTVVDASCNVFCWATDLAYVQASEAITGLLKDENASNFVEKGL